MEKRLKTALYLLAGMLSALIFSNWLGGQQNRTDSSFTPLSNDPIAVEGGEIGNLLRKWHSDGTAAGNTGDYYDNRDGGHSMLRLDPYPQLKKIEYTEEQIKARQNWGMQRRLLPYVVFGNSSTAAGPTQGGSIGRSYYATPGGLEFLFSQYVRNNLYIYPEHRDHDPGHNGNEGYGDLFPANTPYLIISQGSSGSDQPFMRAMPYVLAAFRPEVKKKLVETGMLMPVIQMIFRSTNRHLQNSRDYLSGKAHPTVFKGSDVDALAMVEMAHKITLADIPPIALIRTIKEDVPMPGRDYFDPGLTEKLAETPAAIARIFRGAGYLRQITVSAEGSRDLNNRPLKFHWTVLRGDPDRIKIDYRNPSRSVAEITIPYCGRSPIEKGSSMESNRIDIGVFVHNGAYYSPPAFITFYTLDNEARAYRFDGQPIEIAYGAGTSTVSIADWKLFFDALTSPGESWPFMLLRQRLQAREVAALTGLAAEFNSVHATLLAAQAAQASTAKKTTGSSPEEKKQAAAESASARQAVEAARRSEQQLLEKKLPSLEFGAANSVHRALDSMMRDPTLWEANANAVERLYDTAKKENLEAFRRVQQRLVSFNFAENTDGASFRLKPLIEGRLPISKRITPYEDTMVERLNAALMSQILFPGMVDSAWKENFVDSRIAASKDWRDVYRYAPDGTPLGWTRYHADGNIEFNAEGHLILEKDSSGRCRRARAVKYEVETQKPRDSSSTFRKVRMIPTDAIYEYEYQAGGDWKGRAKQVPQ
jgi:hypothetical protein